MLRLIAVTLVVCIPLTAVAQNAQPVFTLKSVGPNVWAAIDAFGGGSNAGFIVGDDASRPSTDLRGTRRVPKTLPNRAACATPY